MKAGDRSCLHNIQEKNIFKAFLPNVEAVVFSHTGENL